MANIELPKDAEGREIPLDTEVLYDERGDKLLIKRIEFDTFKKEWLLAVTKDSTAIANLYRSPQRVYLEKPATRDSWENLLEDLDNAAKGGDNAECCYMRRDGIEVGTQCHGCKLYERGEDNFSECSYLAYADIAARIRKLAAKDGE